MKKTLNLFLPLLMLAALCLPAFAQEESADQTESSVSGDNPDGKAAKEETTPAAKKAQAKKAAAKAAAEKKAKAAAAAKKKKAKKKKPAPPVSEYKFSTTESGHTYRFDKKGDPIVKASKKKKPAKKAAGKSAAKPAAKLKPSKPMGAEDEAAQPGQDQPAAE